ncbi:hypothetical protein F4678DRAFT_197781 [Xylaria arbuscula]|nr:hypothetical protein F4678DRAFT_197781 [Xylaria arbuscula]
MDRLGVEKDLPSSPWATRFPLDYSVFVSENKNHSFFAPEFPRIDDPKYYDRNPVFLDRPPNGDADIDRFFCSEYYQEETLYSLHTWQAAVLRRYLQFHPDTGKISGGHQRDDVDDRVGRVVYERERIKVDEATWFPFFQKNRWFDWIEAADSPDSKPKTWSVDEPQIWGYLRISIELANRMLLALCRDKHEGAGDNSLWPN